MIWFFQEHLCKLWFQFFHSSITFTGTNKKKGTHRTSPTKKNFVFFSYIVFRNHFCCAIFPKTAMYFFLFKKSSHIFLLSCIIFHRLKSFSVFYKNNDMRPKSRKSGSKNHVPESVTDWDQGLFLDLGLPFTSFSLPQRFFFSYVYFNFTRKICFSNLLLFFQEKEQIFFFN